MVRPYFVSVEGKYEAGPLTVFIYHARDQSCSVSLDQVESACHARAISSPALSRYEEVMPQRPILYSFRRCPYAIRRSEEHTSELQSLMRISYAVFCLKKKNTTKHR